MKNNKIWLISEIYYPVLTSTGHIITEIAEHLAKENNNINVICTGSKYNETTNYKFIQNEIRNNVNIHRVNSGNINKNNIILRIIRLFCASFMLFLKTLRLVKKGDKLYVVTNPAFFLILLPIIKKIKKIQYTILVHDVFPENLVAIGKIKKNSFLFKITKVIFDWAYSLSSTCIVIGRDMKEIIEAKTRNKPRVVLITNWADEKEVYPNDKVNTKIINEHALSDKFVFQFAGNLGHAQGLDNILEAIKLITNNKLHFIFIGTGAKSDTIKSFIQNNPLSNVTLVGFQHRNEQNDFLNACDVSIVTLNQGMFGLGVPSKSYNIMASGKPIIIVADKNSEISICVEEFGIGWVVEPNNPIALKEIFMRAYEEREVIKSKQLKSRQVAETHFAKGFILNKYLELLS